MRLLFDQNYVFQSVAIRDIWHAMLSTRSAMHFPVCFHLFNAQFFCVWIFTVCPIDILNWVTKFGSLTREIDQSPFFFSVSWYVQRLVFFKCPEAFKCLEFLGKQQSNFEISLGKALTGEFIDDIKQFENSLSGIKGCAKVSHGWFKGNSHVRITITLCLC